MRVGLVGINHKLADLKLREQLAKACQKRLTSLQCMPSEHHFVLLSTCNRTEVYFSSEDLATTHTYLLGLLRAEVSEEFDQKLYSYFGEECFFHLTRVSSGLDSAVLAETEIQGQVKMAYKMACEHQTLPKVLHYLFQKALAIAKHVRTELQLGRGLPTLEQAILQTGKQIFPPHEQPRLLFVGASEINQKLIKFLKNKKFQALTLCNRSQEQGEAFAEAYGISFLPWQQLSLWQDYDWTIVGTKSSEYLLTSQQAHRSMTKPKLIMDLCVPRNVDPRLGYHPLITLFNIDQLNRLLTIRHASLNHTLMQAEQKIAHATEQHAKLYNKMIGSHLPQLAITA